MTCSQSSDFQKYLNGFGFELVAKVIFSRVNLYHGKEKKCLCFRHHLKKCLTVFLDCIAYLSMFNYEFFSIFDFLP